MSAMNAQITEAPAAQSTADLPGYWVYVHEHRDGVRNWIGGHWRVLKETKTGFRAIHLHGIRYTYLPALISRRRYNVSRVDAATSARLDESHGDLLRKYVGNVWGTLFART